MEGAGLTVLTVESTSQTDQVIVSASDYFPSLPFPAGLGWGTAFPQTLSLTRAVLLTSLLANSSLSVSTVASVTSLAVVQPSKGFLVFCVASSGPPSAASPSPCHPLLSPLLICLAGVKY